jgi:hypothetical protein
MQTMSEGFKREDRYVVLKRSDIEKYLHGSRGQLRDICRAINAGRYADDKPLLQAVVIESDWPEYEPTWRAIEQRMTGATPATFDLVGHLVRQRAFSERTFGPGMRTAGVCDHIRKELTEIASNPADVLEWVDVILLALDGAWRAGFEPHEIAAAIDAKQTKNEARTWPDWRTVDPNKAIEHVRNTVEAESASAEPSGQKPKRATADGNQAPTKPPAVAHEALGESCSWVEDSDGVWQTSCGESWLYSDGGTPAENSAHFCHHCGKPIIATPHPDDDADLDDETAQSGAGRAQDVRQEANQQCPSGT